MTEAQLSIGSIVLHPARPDWGPGKVLEILSGGHLVIYFRDLPEVKPSDAVKTISTLHVPMAMADHQSDPLLDHLPSYEKKRFKGQRKPRLSIQQAIRGFLERFPKGFADPLFLEEERNAKVAAHEQWRQSLDDGQLRSLLDAGDLAEICNRVADVESTLSLLAVFEKAGLSDALKEEPQAKKYFSALADFLDADQPDQDHFVRLVAAVEDLPQREGGARVASWPVLTQYPFIARPEIYMFLKPDLTKSCAARLNFDLCYAPELSWKTYARLMEMSRLLLDKLEPHGARDFIDVQTFMLVVASL